MKRRQIVRVLVVGILGLFLQTNSTLWAQSADAVVYEQLRKIARGKVEEVKRLLPDLLLEYPNDPGVIFLHGVAANDAMKALPLYEKIVREYPQSQWADDALWRIVQIYAVAGDTAQARRWLSMFEAQYPDSEYLLFARLLVKETVGLGPQRTVQDTTMATPPVIRAPRHNNQPPAQVPNFPPQPSTQQTDTAQQVRYGLQVGIYTSREAAAKELMKYQRLSLRAEVVKKVMGGEPHYAVVIGDYSSKEQAERAKKVVARFCQCNPFLIVK